MKKLTGSILTTAVCVGLSLSAFTLSGFANTVAQTGTANVMEKETPKEYMADFSVAEEELGKQKDSSKYQDTIFVSESQVESLKENTKKVLLEVYDVKIPQDLVFEYYTSDFEGTMKIRLKWFEDKKSNNKEFEGFYRDIVRFNAEYEITGSQGSTLNTVLKSINMQNGYDIKSLESLKNQSLKALKDELGIDVPKDFSVFTNVNSYFDDDKENSAYVEFVWAKDILETDADNYATPCYTIGFEKVDLSKNTGRLSMIEDNAAFVYAKLRDNTVPELTKEQEKEILEAAKRFFAKKGIVAENLMSRGGATRSYQLDYSGGKVMWFVFDQVAENDSTREYIEIFITPEFNVLGYAF